METLQFRVKCGYEHEVSIFFADFWSISMGIMSIETIDMNAKDIYENHGNTLLL